MSRLARLACLLLILVGCSRERVERVEWTVMGTVAAVQWKTGAACDTARLVAATKETFAKVETLLNAHDAASELRRLANLPDAEVLARCDPFVRPCYEAAFRLRDETGRVFNPRWCGPGTLDLGAIAKGYAVDLAAEKVASFCGETAVLIDLGGNLRAAQGTWTTGVSDPATAQLAESANARTFDLLPDMACATSAEYYRGRHIKDGRDGSDASATVASVTVVHPNSAMLADGLSTVMFLLGREKGEAFLRERYPEAKAIWIGE